MFKDRKLRAAAASIACNLLLVLLKVVGARLSLSAGMKADALHSTSDILISGLVFLSIWFTFRKEREGRQPEQEAEETGENGEQAEEDGPRTQPGAAVPHTNDKVLAENLTALLVSLLLIGTALGFLASAVMGYAYPLVRVPVAIGIVWVCIIISYFLSRYKIRVGREEGSISLEADGQHSRMDMYSSVVVFVGLLGNLIGLRLDALASAVVSFLVLKAGAEVLVSSVRGITASEAFTYQSLMGRLGDTSWGQDLAPLYSRLLAPHVAALRMHRTQGVRFIIRNRRAIAAVFVVLALAAYPCSGFYRVQPDEVGVVLRCGKLVDRTAPPAAPGLHYRLPSPISKLYRVKPRAVRQLEFGYRTVARRGEIVEPSAYLWESMHRTGIYEKVEPEAIMLTGDVNELDLNLVVEYCVGEGVAAGFLFNLSDSEALVRAATEHTVRSVVGRMRLTDILTTARPAIEREVFSRLQQLLDEYRACIMVIAVHLQDVHPPVEVVSAFRRVATAREDRSTRINQAEGYRNWTIPRSHGFANQILTDAEAYRAEQKLNAEGDARYFTQIYDAFRKAPEMAAFTMYMDCLEESLPTLRKVVLSDDISSDAAGNTLQRFFMIGEFLKEDFGAREQAGLLYHDEGQ